MAAPNENNRDGGFVDKLVGVRRVAKVVKGGRRFAFSALVVIGDENGRVGFGNGKAKEVPDAVRKATETAKKSMMRVPMREGRTFHHEVEGRSGASRVVLKPAVPGTGIIAGGPMRALFEAMGVKDVVSKSLGSSNPFNMIQATFDAFQKMETPRAIAAKRGMKVVDLRERQGKDMFEATPSDADTAPTASKDMTDAKKPAKGKADNKGKGSKAAAKPAAKKDAKGDKPAAEKPAKEAKASEKPAEERAEVKADAKAEAKAEKAEEKE